MIPVSPPLAAMLANLAGYAAVAFAAWVAVATAGTILLAAVMNIGRW